MSADTFTTSRTSDARVESLKMVPDKVLPSKCICPLLDNSFPSLPTTVTTASYISQLLSCVLRQAIHMDSWT